VRSNNSDLRQELDERDRFALAAYPALVRDLMPDWRVGIVAMCSLPSGYTSDVREALEPAGAQVDSVTVIADPLPLDRIADDLDGTRFRRADRSDEVLERLGRRVGRALVNDGELVERLRKDLFSTTRGEYRELDAVVLVRGCDGSKRKAKGKAKRSQERFEAALIEALRDSRAKVAGIEQTDTDPSQVGYMKDRGVTSVDDLDLVAGKTALVWGLLGGEGHYGVKSSAQRYLPAPPSD
jgi:Copper transport outer membrane protein, MctB